MNRSLTERPFPLKRPIVLALSGVWVLCIAIGGAIALRPSPASKASQSTIASGQVSPTPSTASPVDSRQGFTPSSQPQAPAVLGQATPPASAQITSEVPVQSPVLSAPAPLEPPVTPSKETAVPVTRSAVPDPVSIAKESPVTMPSDVLEWLKHLEKIENRRRSLAQAQTGALIAEFSGLITAGYSALADPEEVPSVTEDQRSRNIQRLSRIVSEYRTEWDGLDSAFWSVKAPDVCSRAASDFGRTLGQTSQMMNEVFGFVMNGENAPRESLEGLHKMTGTSAGRVDSPAKATDDDVQAVCDRYQTRKWFSIQPDVGGGLAGILSRFGR